MEVKEIWVDTREQRNEKELEYFKKHNIEVKHIKLDVGDYLNPDDTSVVIDKKFGMQEISVDFTSQKARIEKEFQKAKDLGVKLVVLIDDCNFSSINSVKFWNSTYYRRGTNGKSQQMKGNVLMNEMKSMHEKYGVVFMFCKKGDAGKYIVDILNGTREVVQK